MDFERPKELSKLEQIKIERERVKSDSGLIDGGAKDIMDKEGDTRLEITKKQKERMHADVIKLPEDIKMVKSLQEKRKEYIDRIKQQRANRQDCSDEIYKIAVIDKILLEGRAEKDNLRDELKKEYDGIIYEEGLEEAMLAIEDYVETGGKNVRGDTGFGDNIKK